MARKRNKSNRHGTTNAVTRDQSRAFTLVELLIVITIIGILATIVVPQFSNASAQARENALKDELRYLRTQIVVYKAQHKDIAPGVNGDFIDQMTLYTSDAGATSATASATHKFGPYLPKIPKNPLNDLNTIEIVSNANPLTADGGHGWKYNSQTQEIIADVLGNDTVGSPFAKY
jgi:general secretion pathway protein G